MLGKENLPYASMSEGEISMLLWARNQQLRSIVAFKKGNTTDSDKHSRAAEHFRKVVQMGLHQNTSAALAYPSNNVETNDVNRIVSKAMKATEPALKFTKQEVTNSLRFVSTALNGGVIDEFDPTPEQVTKCRSESEQKARNQLIANGKTFTPGSFDPNTEEVARVGNTGTLVVINKSELAVLTNQILTECLARVPFENIINQKLTDAGNFVIYRLMEDTGVDIRFNNKVNNRIFQQSSFIAATAKATGLSQSNVKMVLQNSAIRINEETPRETLNSVYPLFFNPDVNSPVPTGLPPIGTSQASDFFAQIIVKIAVGLINLLVNSIKKRRAEAYAEIPDPSIIAARCTDANIPLANCVGLDNDFIENNRNGNESSSSTGFILGGLAVLGIGVALVSNNRKNKRVPNKLNSKKYEYIEYSEV